MSMNSLLDEVIKKELEELKEMDTGSDQYKATVDGVTKLIDRTIEIERVKSEIEERENQMVRGAVDAEDGRRDQLFKNCIAVAGIVIPSAITIWGTVKSLKFEEEGTVTTIMGRGFINKLLPKK